MKLNIKKLKLHLPSISWLHLVIFFLLLSSSHELLAVSQYYAFEGNLTTLADPYTRTAIKAGYEEGDYIHFLVEIDFDRQGYYISPTSGLRVTPDDTDTIDYFYANLISGTEITHTTVSGVVYENLAANYSDASRSYINLANYLVLMNGVNPIDWRVGDVVTSSDRWDGYGSERMDGRVTLMDISDMLPTREVLANNWTEIPFSREIINFIYHHPADNSVFVSARPYGGIYSKPDNSVSFSSRSGGLVDTNVKDMAFSPASASTLYAATLHGGIYESTSGGNTWEQSNNGIQTRSNMSTDAYSVAVSPSDSNVVYAGTLFGLYKSIDAGVNWELQTTPFNNSRIGAIRITSDNNIFIGTNAGLYSGTVGGDSWTNQFSSTTVIPNNASVTDLKPIPANPNVFVVGVEGLGAYIIDVINGSFERLNLPPASAGERYLAGFAGDVLYVAADQSGLFRSDDLNQSWFQVTLPMVNGNFLTVNAFSVDVNEQLSIGSNHQGIFYIERAMQQATPVDTTEFKDNVESGDDGGGAVNLWFVLLILMILFVKKSHEILLSHRIRKVYD